MAKLTINELAKMAGVSPTAVSFVLNNKPGVSDNTRKKIHDIIEKIGYTPNINSRCLVLQKSLNIALIYSESSSPFDDLFYFEVARGALDHCNKKGYTMVLDKITTSADGHLSLPGVVTNRNTDGIILFQDVDCNVLKEIEKYGAPVVVVDSYAEQTLYTSIGISAPSIVKTALEYLISCGHKKIGMISMDFIPNFKEQVCNTFQDILAQHNLPYRPEWVKTTANCEEAAMRCAEEIWSYADHPTVLFCTSDIYALGAISYFKSRGISVPEDVSVIGADNIIACKYTDPALTTVDYDKVLLGSVSCEMLIRCIDGAQVESIRLDPIGVKERNSVKKIR